ncbi:hypothetical protein VDQ74_14525 [Xanthomonas campestris pv. campestris]|nr:hypothetical protein [Xanthomonas campestris pv. campestris]
MTWKRYWRLGMRKQKILIRATCPRRHLLFESVSAAWAWSWLRMLAIESHVSVKPTLLFKVGMTLLKRPARQATIGPASGRIKLCFWNS